MEKKDYSKKDDKWWEERLINFFEHYTSGSEFIDEILAGWRDGLINSKDFVLTKRVKKINGETFKKVKITDVKHFRIEGTQQTIPYADLKIDPNGKRVAVFLRERAPFFSSLPPEILAMIGGFMDAKSKQALKSTCHNLHHDRYSISKRRNTVALAVCALPYHLGLSVRIVSPAWDRSTFSVLICPVEPSVAALTDFLNLRPYLWLEVESHVISPSEHKTGASGSDRASRFSPEYKKYMAEDFIRNSKTQQKAQEELNAWLVARFPAATQFVLFHSSYIHNSRQEIETFFGNQPLIIDLSLFPQTRDLMRDIKDLSHMDTNAPIVARLVRKVVPDFWTTLPLTHQTIDDLKFQLVGLEVSDLIKARLLQHFKGAAVMLALDVDTIMASCAPKLQQPNKKPLEDFLAAHRDDGRRPHHDLVFAFLKQITKCPKDLYYNLPYLEMVHGLIQCLMSRRAYVHPVSACKDEFFALLSPFTGEPAAPTYHECCCRKYTQQLTYHAVQGRKRCSKASKNYVKSIWPAWPERKKKSNDEGDMLEDSDDLCCYCGRAPATCSFYDGEDVCEDCRESQSFAFD